MADGLRAEQRRALGIDLRRAVQSGFEEGPEAQGNEGQRFLGYEPLYRKAELGHHAGRGPIR